jgi:hypothetical protein
MICFPIQSKNTVLNVSLIFFLKEVIWNFERLWPSIAIYIYSWYKWSISSDYFKLFSFLCFFLHFMYFPLRHDPKINLWTCSTFVFYPFHSGKIYLNIPFIFSKFSHFYAPTSLKYYEHHNTACNNSIFSAHTFSSQHYSQ